MALAAAVPDFEVAGGTGGAGGRETLARGNDGRHGPGMATLAREPSAQKPSSSSKSRSSGLKRGVLGALDEGPEPHGCSIITGPFCGVKLNVLHMLPPER